MRASHPVIGLLFLVALVGCGNNNARSLFHGGGVPPVSTPTYRILPGASTIVFPGQQAGYGVSANVGGSYRLVWTGDTQTGNGFQHFFGSIWTLGSFSSVTVGCAGGFCPLEPDDAIANPVVLSDSQRIDFDTFASDGLDGLDFVVDTEPVYFDVFIDGSHFPDLVFFPATDNGGRISTVAAIPFGLTTN